jgi:TRAP-type C4-dicarboxylate transport system substrate-binding protein
MMFYTETTADGYEVWIATDNDRNPNVNEDIYYYDNDWLERMPDAMIDGASIYYDQLDDEEYAFQEVIEEVYDDYYNDKKKEIENELIEEGYEYENEEETISA